MQSRRLIEGNTWRRDLLLIAIVLDLKHCELMTLVFFLLFVLFLHFISVALALAHASGPKHAVVVARIIRGLN